MKKILFASNNQGKIREVVKILSNLGIKIMTPDQVFNKKIDVIEDGTTFEENAYKKAKEMGDKSNLITIADDSGLEVDELKGEPGVYSARYDETTEKRNQKVLNNLASAPKERRIARYKIAICIYDPQTKNHETVFGSCEGIITQKPVGDNGFGYDPIFYSEELGKTFGQASDLEKNKISHRKIALEKLKNILPTYIK
ncbi:RdgB/HAM1 family non-canonical purine NTP pyrophosphatase [Patescibacteria group bacterium]